MDDDAVSYDVSDVREERRPGKGGNAKTLVERMGFRDRDLTTPQHDEIMLWLDQELQDSKLLRKLTGEDKRAPGSLLGYIEEQEQAALNDGYVLPKRPVYPQPKLSKTVWEQPIGDPPRRGSSFFIAGFLDLYAKVYVYEKADLCTHNAGTAGGRSDSHCSCGSMRCCGEKHNNPLWHVYLQDYHFAFEVKSSIPSLGELVREVRFYQSKTHLKVDGSDYRYASVRFFVVSGDDRWADALSRQGIGFVSYPSGEVTMP
jgi:hypothetical protein